jgi:hypothetical protein
VVTNFEIKPAEFVGGGGDIVTTWQPKKKVPENPTKKVLFEEKWHKITTFPKKKKSQIC